MESASAGQLSTQATHYEVLDLQPLLLSDAEPRDASTLVKRAYRRALLRNHPDKSGAAQSHVTTAHKLSETSPYTIDQISSAYAVLSVPEKRREYDAALRVSRLAGSAGSQGQDGRFQTGIENVDLDDLEFDEKEERWYRSCRCGNDRGYLFQEDDLIEASDDGVLMVGCQDCSLWLKVHFAAVEDDGQ